MFTGLITAIGTVVGRTSRNGGLDMTIEAPWPDLELGESVAVRGACLTVTHSRAGEFAVHVVDTTLGRTLFADMAAGARVNLERALRVGDRMGGHWVQGHVDGLGTVVATVSETSAHLIDIMLPPDVADVTIPLGSLAVDGVSLTVNVMPQPQVAQVAIVPHTLQHTTLAELRAGDSVHLEGDLVGKHVRALATPWSATRELR